MMVNFKVWAKNYPNAEDHISWYAEGRWWQPIPDTAIKSQPTTFINVPEQGYLALEHKNQTWQVIAQTGTFAPEAGKSYSWDIKTGKVTKMPTISPWLILGLIALWVASKKKR